MAMTNEEKAKRTYPYYEDMNDMELVQTNAKRIGFIAGCEWKDEQPIKESGGWHTEQPTEDGWYLVDTPDFPKNCHFVVAEWDNDAKNFYDEHSDYPIKFIGWKLIERR